METRFQTSFIPRKPLVSNSPIEPKKGSTSVFLIISFVALLLSIGSAIGVTVWGKILEKSIESKKSALEQRKAQFGSDIDFLKKFNTKISSAKSLIDNHIAVSSIFDVISSITVEEVRFTTFDFSLPADTTNSSLILNMKGEANSFPALASQSDVLAQGKLIQDPIITDMALAENGKVTFTFSGKVLPESVLYRNLFKATSTTEVIPEIPPTIEDISNPNQ